MYYYGHPSIMQNWLYYAYLTQQTAQNVQYHAQIPQTHSTANSPTGSAFLDQQRAMREQIRQNNQNLIDNQDAPKNQFLQAKPNKNEEDQDYTPDKGNQNCSRNNRQDSNRNVVPNTIHQVLSFLQKKTKSSPYVLKAFSKIAHQPTWTVKRFYLYQLKLKEQVNHYVNEDTLNLLNILHQPQFAVYSENQQRFYLKVCRVIVHHFLNHQSAVLTLTSKRMNVDKKKEHLKARRLIQTKLDKVYGKQI